MSTRPDAVHAEELSLESGRLAESIEAIHRAALAVEEARRAVDGARDGVTERRSAFASTLREELAARRAAGSPGLAEQLVGVVRSAYWDHPEVRVADIAKGTGFSPAEVREIAGPVIDSTACTGCGRAVQVTCWSRTERDQRRALCPGCRAAERARWQPSPFLFDGHQLDLYRHLDQRLEVVGCDHSLALTRRWAMREGLDAGDLMAWVRARGGFCDCEVLSNVPQDMAW